LRISEPCLALVLLACASATGAQSPATGDGSGTEGYRQLVRRYASGDPSAAALLALSPRVDLAAVVTNPGECAPASVLALHAAALLLHSAREAEAKALIEAGSALSGRQDGGDDFARRWQLAAGYLWQSYGNHDRAYWHYQTALRLSHDDPECLLARATAIEFSALPDGYGAVPVARDEILTMMNRPFDHFMGLAASTTARSRLLELIARSYEDILARNASLGEARLRLGRVLAAYGQRRQAVADLRAVASSDSDPFLVSVAHLCLAQLASDTAEAVGEYRAALEAVPSLRAAWVGLSHSLLQQGERATAREAIEHAFVAEGDPTPDPWVDYHLGRGRAFPGALAALRASIAAGQ
jgi:tetratricopeptide (TPR) repeat protein